MPTPKGTAADDRSNWMMRCIGYVGKTSNEIRGPAHFLQIRPEPVQRRALELAGKIGRQRLSNSRFNLGHGFIPPSTGIASECLVKRG